MAVHSFNRCGVHSQHTVQDRFSGIVASYQKVSHCVVVRSQILSNQFRERFQELIRIGKQLEFRPSGGEDAK
jgi:hypothetical protein